MTHFKRLKVLPLRCSGMTVSTSIIRTHEGNFPSGNHQSVSVVKHWPISRV